MFSFSRNKAVVDLYPYIRRICDLTTPNLITTAEERSEDRFNRTIPTLVCPWSGKQPLVDQCAVSLTSDLADRGIRLVHSQPITSQQVVVGYWIESDEMPEPWYFLGNVRRVQAMGGGFWAIGIELNEFANKKHRAALECLQDAAENLLPPVEVAAG